MPAKGRLEGCFVSRHRVLSLLNRGEFSGLSGLGALQGTLACQAAEIHPFHRFATPNRAREHAQPQESV